MCGIGLFSYITYVHVWKILTVWYIVDFVNKISRDKRLSMCKLKGEMVQSDIVEYYPRSNVPYCWILKKWAETVSCNFVCGPWWSFTKFFNELFFINPGFFTFSSKTRSIVPHQTYVSNHPSKLSPPPPCSSSTKQSARLMTTSHHT